MYKVCSKCKQELPVEFFGKSSSSKDGYYCYCKECAKKYREENKGRDRQRYLEKRDSILAYKKEYAKKNKEKIAQKQKEYRESHRTELLEKQKKRQRENKDQYSYTKHKVGGRFSAYKSNAEKRKIPFNLTIQQFDSITSMPCKYCGEYDTYEDMKFTGVDRIDSRKGYDIGNCVSCCRSCNAMKSDSDVFEWLEKIKKIYTHNF